MDVLVTDAESPTADVAALARARARHVVHRCHDQRDPLHCVVERGARGPLDVAPIDVRRHAGYLNVTLDASFRELDGDARGIDVVSPTAVAR